MIPSRHAATLVVVAGLGGCASGPESTPPSAAETPLLVVGASRPAEGSISAADAFPAGEAEERWLSAPGPDTTVAGATPIVVSTRAVAEHGAAFARTVPGETVEFLSTGSGGVDLHAVLSPGDAALSIFATPIRLLPPSLPAGSEHRSTAPLEVVEADDPSRRKDRGTGERVATYVRDAEIIVAGRSMRAQVLESTFTARLRTATATRTVELFLVPGVGPVAERWRREVLVLGLVRTVREGLRVRDPGAGP